MAVRTKFFLRAVTMKLLVLAYFYESCILHTIPIQFSIANSLPEFCAAIEWSTLEKRRHEIILIMMLSSNYILDWKSLQFIRSITSDGNTVFMMCGNSQISWFGYIPISSTAFIFIFQTLMSSSYIGQGLGQIISLN